jgi:D-amino-acid dehydrogenase
MGRNLRWLFRSSSPLYVAPRLDFGLLRWLVRFQRCCRRDHLLYATRVLCELGTAGAALFETLAEKFDFGYQRRGRLEVCRRPATLEEAAEEAELLAQFGFHWERLSGEEVRAREPAIDVDVAGAIYYPESAYCNPLAFVERVAGDARAQGATILTQTAATGFSIARGRVHAVETTGGVLDADAVVLACGPWSPQWAHRLGVRLPIQPGKGYHLDLANVPNMPRIPAVFVEDRLFVTPIDDRLRLAGTMEFSGFNLHRRPARLDMLHAGAKRYFPQICQAPIVSRWCHLRPMTPDGLPIIGPLPRIPNFWIAAGHGMLGLTQGPVTGEIIADAIQGRNPRIDLAPLRVDRF